jgi:hypothetical protein
VKKQENCTQNDDPIPSSVPEPQLRPRKLRRPPVEFRRLDPPTVLRLGPLVLFEDLGRDDEVVGAFAELEELIDLAAVARRRKVSSGKRRRKGEEKEGSRKTNVLRMSE